MTYDARLIAFFFIYFIFILIRLHHEREANIRVSDRAILIFVFRIGHGEGGHSRAEQRAPDRHGQVPVHSQKQRAADGQQGIQCTNTL